MIKMAAIFVLPMTREEKKAGLKSKLDTCDKHGYVAFLKKFRSTKKLFGFRWECSECLKDNGRKRRRLGKTKYPCKRCGATIPSGTYCNKCREIILREDRVFVRDAQEVKLAKYDSYLANCDRLGTCDILKMHHEMLKEDDNRLSTEFILNLICPIRKDKKENDKA